MPKEKQCHCPCGIMRLDLLNYKVCFIWCVLSSRFLRDNSDTVETKGGNN